MANLNRVDIYVGVVGQAYVDKETALKNLNAAIKNVNDMIDIISAANAQITIAENILNNARGAKDLAQETFNRLTEKINQLGENNPLYKQLLSIKNSLYDNDIDNNFKNGGNTITANANIENIEKQITELHNIINEGNESLIRRRALVEELQVVYNNAVEVFESYLPEEDIDIFAAFDAEEEALKARLEEAIAALNSAQEITDAINATSQDVIDRAILSIINACKSNGSKYESVKEYLNAYNNRLGELNNEFASLKNLVAPFMAESTEAVSINNEIDIDMSTIDSQRAEISNMFTNVNSNMTRNNEIQTMWESNREELNESFSISLFENSVNEINGINDDINNNKRVVRQINSTIITLESALESLRSRISNLSTVSGDNNGNASGNDQETIPSTYVYNGITYYRTMPLNPGDGYELRTVENNGTTYYAYVYVGNTQPVEPTNGYFWYLGTTKPATDAYIEENGTQISSASDISRITIDTDDYVYFAYPVSFGTARIVDTNGDDAPGKSLETLNGVTLENYKGWRFNNFGNGARYNISFN